jgi:two-component system response regulator LytT
MRVLVVDDEQLARDELCYQLDQLGDVEIVGQAADGLEALAAVERHEPDLVFLDIQMPGLGGFEVARRLLEKGDEPPALVFVTAFDQHAIEAFDVNAVDYLLKPVESGRLEQALQRARKRVEADRQGPSGSLPVNDQLEKIVKLMTSGRQIRRDQVAIRVGERFMLVQAEEIIYASLADDSINIVTGQVAGTSNYRTLDDLQARLDPDIFWRVHRSHLVNINKIKEIVPWFSRNYILRMKDTKGTRGSKPSSLPPSTPR